MFVRPRVSAAAGFDGVLRFARRRGRVRARAEGRRSAQYRGGVVAAGRSESLDVFAAGFVAGRGGDLLAGALSVDRAVDRDRVDDDRARRAVLLAFVFSVQELPRPRRMLVFVSRGDRRGDLGSGAVAAKPRGLSW